MIQPDTTKVNQAKSGRFGWHPDLAIDYCVEVNDLVCEHHAMGCGISVLTLPELQDRIFKASMFRVGGDLDAVNARADLRKLEQLMDKGLL